jgi:formylmethanofuran dehydrogenase subunit E
MGVRPITIVIPDGLETAYPPATFGIGKETPSFCEAVPYPETGSFLLFGETRMDIQALLELSSRDHVHLCPRQILGVRIGLAGMKALGFHRPPTKKQLLVISETDGCFVDGVIAATGCTVGHRTLRVEDYGKVAATFVDTVTGGAIRVAPALDVREKAYAYAPDELRHYFAQMQAYQVMPDDEMLIFTTVTLNTPINEIISRPGVRVNCDLCGEEIMNEREVHQNGLTLCPSCAHGGYYHVNQQMVFHLSQNEVERIPVP